MVRNTGVPFSVIYHDVNHHKAYLLRAFCGTSATKRWICLCLFNIHNITIYKFVYIQMHIYILTYLQSWLTFPCFLDKGRTYIIAFVVGLVFIFHEFFPTSCFCALHRFFLYIFLTPMLSFIDEDGLLLSLKMFFPEMCPITAEEDTSLHLFLCKVGFLFLFCYNLHSL